MNNINNLDFLMEQEKTPLAAQVAVFCRYFLPLCQEIGRRTLEQSRGD